MKILKIFTDKKGLGLKDYVISFFIVTAIILSTTFLIADLQLSTGTPVNATYNGTYDLMNQSLQIANQTSSQLQSSSISSTSFQAGLLSGFPIIRIVFNGYSIIFNLVHNVADDLQLPNWVAPLLLGIVSTLLIFALVSALFNRYS